MKISHTQIDRTEADLRREFAGSMFVIAAGHFDFFGGAERQAILLARELIERYDCRVQFLGWGGDGVLADHARRIGATPVVFPLDINQRGWRQKKDLLRLAYFIRTRLQPDYLLPFVGIHCKIVGAIWKLTGARFCWWNQRDEGRRIQGTRTEFRLLNSLPGVVSNSFEGRDFLVQKFKLPRERVRVINNGIELPKCPDGGRWRTQLKLSENDLLFSMIANLTQFKDHATLLKAFATVRGNEFGSRCHLVLAGRHDDTAQALKALAFDLGLSGSVHMPGAITDTDHLLEASDLVVHSSVMEGCPNAVLEAMAHGRCVLGTNISGIRQALGEDDEQFLVAPRNHECLAQQMLRLGKSPAQRRLAGMRNQERIRTHFSIDRMCREVLETVSEFRLGTSKH